MSMTEEDRQLLGELKTHAEYTKEGITEIKESVKSLAENTRDNVIALHIKADKAKEAAEDVGSDLKSHKAKITGFAAAISAVWALVMGWVKD